MRTTFLLLIPLLGTVACARTEYSEPLQEPAIVAEVVFSPSTHGIGAGPAVGGKGGVAIVVVSTAEKFAVVFRCPHGKFIIEGESGSTAHRLWNELKEGQQVNVTYREVYRVKKNVRSLVDYDFLEAK